MTLNQNGESQQHIEQVAGEALDQFERIAAKAKSKLQGGQPLGSDSLASVNSFMATEAIQSLGDISQANRESYQTLAKEPAIARVVVDDDWYYVYFS